MNGNSTRERNPPLSFVKALLNRGKTEIVIAITMWYKWKALNHNLIDKSVHISTSSRAQSNVLSALAFSYHKPFISPKSLTFLNTSRRSKTSIRDLNQELTDQKSGAFWLIMRTWWILKSNTSGNHKNLQWEMISHISSIPLFQRLQVTLTFIKYVFLVIKYLRANGDIPEHFITKYCPL